MVVVVALAVLAVAVEAVLLAVAVAVEAVLELAVLAVAAPHQDSFCKSVCAS